MWYKIQLWDTIGATCINTFDGRRQKSSPIYKHFVNEHDAATPNLCAFVTSSTCLKNATQNSTVSLNRYFLFAILNRTRTRKLTRACRKYLFKEFTFVSTLIIRGSKLFKYIWMIYVLYSLHGKGITMTSKRCLFTLLFTCFCFNLLKREIIFKKGSVTMDNKKRKRPLVLCLSFRSPSLRCAFFLPSP